jgi:methionine sulfoxide reductase heme-binding subunit
LTLLQHRVLNGWPLFNLIALLTLGGMVAGMLIIGISSPEATVKLIRLSVQFASPWIYIAFVTSALTTLFPNAFSKWLLRNRRYTGLSFAAGFGWQAVFIAVLLTLYPAHYWDDLHKASDLLGRSLSYIFLLALTITSFLSVRRKMSRAQWHWLHLIGIWYFWAAIWVSYAEQALSQNAKTIDVVFALLGLLVLILRLAANINSRGIIAARKST